MTLNKWVIAGALAALGLTAGCRDTDRKVQEPAVDQRGTGGSGYDNDGKRIGDGKIGNQNGVIDDGEGPLERDGVADDKIGDKPGVWNDGEGPLEENPNTDRPEK